MSKKQKKVLWPLLAIAALGLSAYAFTSSRGLSGRSTPETKPGNQNPFAVANAAGDDYVRMSRLPSQLRWSLKALGDRIQKPGKERLTLTGTLQDANAAPVPVLLVLEFPDHLRIEMQGTGPHRIITFNGKTAGKPGGRLDQGEQDLIETLVYDTAEHFFSTQTGGQATRLLGSRFRLDDGSSPNYSGPFYDIYEVSDQIDTSPQSRQQTKCYFLNSETLMPERVQYEVERNGSPMRVEIRASEWQPAQGQQIARRIVRLENNQPVLTLVITSVVLSSKLDDGLFG